MKTPEQLLQAVGLAARDGEKHPFIVCSDFDGTITTRGLCNATLETFGKPEWLEWEARWRRGEVASDECMRRQFATVTASEEQLRDLYERAEVAAGFTEFVRWCRGRGIPFIILSDGIDLCIRPVLARLGLADVPFVCNGAALRDGRFEFRFPHRSEACGRCGTCKCSFMQAIRTVATGIVYLGDGYSARCAAMLCDTLYAKGALVEMCERAGRSYRAFTDFRGLRADLEGEAEQT